jgi:hypothetical protein
MLIRLLLFFEAVDIEPCRAQNLFQLILSVTASQAVSQGGLRLVVKIIAKSLSQHAENHIVPTPLSEIRVGE